MQGRRIERKVQVVHFGGWSVRKSASNFTVRSRVPFSLRRSVSSWFTPPQPLCSFSAPATTMAATDATPEVPAVELDFDVTGLAATTVVSVRAVWGEMGMPQHDQDLALAGLVTAAREVFTRFSDEQTAARDAARAYIADTRALCVELAKNMHLQAELVSTRWRVTEVTQVTQSAPVSHSLRRQGRSCPPGLPLRPVLLRSTG